jgi:hypothetical protein
VKRIVATGLVGLLLVLAGPLLPLAPATGADAGPPAMGADAGPRATVVIDASGDGRHPLKGPRGVAIGPDGSAYVVGMMSDNVFRLAPDGTISQILDGGGDGRGNRLRAPRGVASTRGGTSSSRASARTPPSG